MIGIQPSEQRRMLDEGMDAIMHLLRSRRAAHDARPTGSTCADAKSQLPLYSGPRDRGGRHRLAVGAAHRRQARHRAAVDRRHHADRRRRAGPALRRVGRDGPARAATRPTGRTGASSACSTCAETREQACATSSTASSTGSTTCSTPPPRRSSCPEGETLQERIDWVNETGIGAIGTAEDCISQIETPVEAVGRVRHLPVHGPRLRQPGRQGPQLRADGPAGDAALPERTRSPGSTTPSPGPSPCASSSTRSRPPPSPPGPRRHAAEHHGGR